MNNTVQWVNNSTNFVPPHDTYTLHFIGREKSDEMLIMGSRSSICFFSHKWKIPHNGTCNHFSGWPINSCLKTPTTLNVYRGISWKSLIKPQTHKQHAAMKNSQKTKRKYSFLRWNINARAVCIYADDTVYALPENAGTYATTTMVIQNNRGPRSLEVACTTATNAHSKKMRAVHT